MKRCVLFLAVAATASAVTIREATCSHSYYQSGELVSVVQTSGTSGCTAGEFDGVYASARNDFQFFTFPDRTFLNADTEVMARGAEDQERDAQVLGSARTVIEVSLTGITAGPVRPGLLYVSGSFLTSRPSGTPGPSPRMSVTLGDVELA